MNPPDQTPSVYPAVDVVAGILWQSKRFLAVKRPEGKPLAGYWEFPGGKVEPGENFLDALARELREELDVDVREAELWRQKQHQYEHLNVRLHFYQIRDYDGSPVSREGQDMAWLTPRAALDYPFLPADAEIVRNLIHRGSSPTINQ